MTSTTFFIIFVPILAILLLAINLILAPHNPYQEKDSVFECGFHSFLGQNRTQFSVSFFIFGILFLLFDLEIVLIYPYSVSSYTNDIYGLVVMMVFFVLLTLGFIFELGKNALTIDSRQTFYNNGDVSTPHAFISISFIFGYIWSVPQLFSDYLRILKDKCAPGLEWELHNPPKPHAFTSLPLQSSLRTDINKFEKDCDKTPNSDKLRQLGDDKPANIRGASDTMLYEIELDREKLLGRVRDEHQQGNIDSDRAEDLTARINDAAARAERDIKETNNVAVECIDDTSDTEGYIYHILPFIFVLELPIIRILSVIYTLYNLNLFSIWIYYGTLLMNRIRKK